MEVVVEEVAAVGVVAAAGVIAAGVVAAVVEVVEGISFSKSILPWGFPHRYDLGV